MSYNVVFDSISSDAGWVVWYAPLMAVAVIILVVVAVVTVGTWRRGWRARILGIGLLILFLCKFTLDSYFSHYRYTRWWHHTSSFQIVEGRVSNYRAFSLHDVNFEQFQVGGMSFSYANLGIEKCFHKPTANGGPIREGLPVRMSYDGDCVVKLEVGAPPK